MHLRPIQLFNRFFLHFPMIESTQIHPDTSPQLHSIRSSQHGRNSSSLSSLLPFVTCCDVSYDGCVTASICQVLLAAIHGHPHGAHWLQECRRGDPTGLVDGCHSISPITVIDGGGAPVSAIRSLRTWQKRQEQCSA